MARTKVARCESNLRICRLVRGLTQKQLAAAAGVATSDVSNAERHLLAHTVSDRSLAALAAVLNVWPPEALLGDVYLSKEERHTLEADAEHRRVASGGKVWKRGGPQEVDEP